ncbi:lipopolysaccharide biosynthesis protein [Sulfurimonas sp.]|uniref:lipopolysaccharide biosynthesis protein n=1 Tax=Sulfurimonas sp. TaxID=2022749 RepID=UPI003D0A94CA
MTNQKYNEWKQTSLKYTFSSVVFLVFLYIDKLILEFVHPDEAVVGYYSILIVLVGLFTLISNSLKPIVVPYISAYLEDNTQKNNLQTLINQTNFFLFLLTFVLFFLYFFAGKEILSFYGKNGEYSVVYEALVYLAISQIFLETGRLELRFLLFSGYTHYINKVFLFSIILLLILGTTLTYLYGLYGIIVAHLITSFLYMLAFIFKAKKEFQGIKILSVF